MSNRRALHSILHKHGPMVAFTVLTLGGSGFIVTTKLWGLNTLVVTGVPIAFMLFYMFLSLLFEGFRLHNEQAGDNLYYMGFLFTLTSLGVSLYRFADETSIDQIVQNFGIAISSTICGIALRIFFNQMRRDPLDIERSVRHELAEMTRRVRSELDSSAREFSSYRRTSSQMLVEGFEEIAVQAEKTGTAVQRAIEILSMESVKPIKEASEKLAAISEQNLSLFEQRSDKLNEMAEEAAQRLAQTSGQISELIEKFGNAVEVISQKAKTMNTLDEVLRVEIEPAVEAIRITGELQKRLAEESAEKLNQHAIKTAETLQPLVLMPDRLTKALQPIQTLSGSISDALHPVADASQRLSDSLDTLNKTTLALSKATQAISVPQQASFASQSIDNSVVVPAPRLRVGEGMISEAASFTPKITAMSGDEQANHVQTPKSGTSPLDGIIQSSTPESDQEPQEGSQVKKSWFPW